MKQTIYALALLALLAPAHPALCQQASEGDLGALMAGTGAPLSVKLSDLNASWRRLSASAPLESTDPSSIYARLLSDYVAAADTYYTQGHTVKAGNETYLVAYHRQFQPGDLAMLLQHGLGRNAPQPVPFTPNTVLMLSLLNLRTVGSLNDIQSFDLQKELAAAPQAPAESASQKSINNLKQLGLGWILYTQDYDEMLPSMKDAATMKKALLPYVKDEQVFVQPDTKRPYKVNTSLSKRTLASFNDPMTMVIFYEDAPGPDNMRAVAFMDGHVKRIPEAQWPALKRASHVPGP